MDTHLNLVNVTITNTPGTSGALTLGPAVSSWRSFGSGDNGKTFSVLITQPGVGKEVRTGCTYTHSGTSLSRGTLEKSTTDAAISLTSSAIVSVVMTAALGNVLQAVASGAANQLVTGATAGYTTGWLPAFAFPERFAVKPTGVSGTASITIDASLDGVTATQTLGIIGLTSPDNTKQFYTPAIVVGYPYVRISVTADGSGTHEIARGV